MNRESLLAIVALVVVVAALSTLGLSGAIAAPEESETDAALDAPPALLEVTIAADDVASETATLEVDTYLEDRGVAAENVTIVHRTTNTDTSLIEDTTALEVGIVEPDTEDVVTGTIDVPREGSHEIETFVYVDGMRVESTTHRISGLDSLTPAYAETGLDFHRFGEDGASPLADVPAIEYSIESADGETATLDVSSYLTNGGDETADELEVELKARQADSNIVADRKTVDVGAVDSGNTATPSATLEVPDEYRYQLDAILWLDGTIVATDRAGADLRPESVVENASDADERGLDAGDFEEDDEALEAVEEDAADDSARDVPDEEAEDAGDATPGFGPIVVAAALLGVLALTRRKNQ
ncbi:DUF7490 domain-containing protein [Natrarchaeobaculum sulfurireducens]|uniref:DUF7490 domain-containing protein n=1 Tax=Natrarchaeobaculum sulfurireducens TaxID=2044521 RepID=A0A346PTU1_9EURY|nr:PGF-CTERM sorting domain-containing protein [Natrarchaeobaculum sulfurireducens]AXR77098.1 hypothetical protein AArc1_0755 [Natrarchaeobaculum sulfurireducens]AXR82936.1 hypothetical protein AArcMg_2948 [Natrarchaeobaculum sulfurireducens]